MPDIRSIDVRSEPGYIIIQTDSGPPVKYPLTDLIRGADIPEISVSEASTRILSIPVLANILVILIRTLIERNVLDESFIDSLGMDWDLEHITYAIEQMGGAYHNPALDNVEDD